MPRNTLSVISVASHSCYGMIGITSDSCFSVLRVCQQFCHFRSALVICVSIHKFFFFFLISALLKLLYVVGQGMNLKSNLL